MTHPSSRSLLKFATMGAVMALSASAVEADTIDQTVFSPTSSTWNTALIWGNNNVTAGNDYQMVAGGTLIETTFTVDFGAESTAWSVYSQVRDYGGISLPTSDSTFSGDNLLIAAQSRFLSKARNSTSTANFVLQDGGMMFLAPGGVAADGPGTSTWAGTITTSGRTIIGLGVNNDTNITTLNIVAPISGSGTLTLTGKGNLAGFLNLSGDLSGFTGTFLLAPAREKTDGPLSYSIADSAPSATLQLDYESQVFNYDLSTNDVSFGSVILGTDTVLAEGTYDAADLNALTGDRDIFSGSGTITVVPEPTTVTLCAIAAGGAIMGGCRHRRRRAIA